MSNAVALTVADSLNKMEGEFRKALPQHIPSERFTRIAVSAVNSNPELLGNDIDKRSLYSAVMMAAQDGVVLDKREAALVTFKNKSGGKTVQYLIMVAGVIKKMRNSGEIANISTGKVYRKEYETGRFEYIKGDEESLTHKPILFEDKGDMIGVYAIVTLKDGSKVREFMDMKQINKVKAASRSRDSGPWVSWFDEMAEKSVLRKVAKRCPSSSDLDDAFKNDDDTSGIEQEPIDATPSSVPEEPKKTVSALDKVKATVQAAPPSPVQEAQYEDVPHPESPQQELINEEEIPI